LSATRPSGTGGSGRFCDFATGSASPPKTVYRICALKRWFVHQRPVAPRPWVQGRISHAGRSNERWATDLTHVYCGRDGWAHLVAVIDCHDRELIGHEFALRGRAKEAERALEEACLERFGTLRPAGATPVVRSDNGLIYQSRRFRAACRDYRLTQEFITPYTPEQNGIIERFFRSLKEECVWQHNFTSFDHRHWAIGARTNSGHAKSLRWLDSREALHIFHPWGDRRHERPPEAVAPSLGPVNVT
jgi:putative transposase